MVSFVYLCFFRDLNSIYLYFVVFEHGVLNRIIQQIAHKYIDTQIQFDILIVIARTERIKEEKQEEKKRKSPSTSHNAAYVSIAFNRIGYSHTRWVCDANISVSHDTDIGTAMLRNKKASIFIFEFNRVKKAGRWSSR